MGFSAQHAREALLHSNNNFDAATEYLLTTPAPAVPASSSGGEGSSSGGATADTSEAAATTGANEVSAIPNFHYSNLSIIRTKIHSPSDRNWPKTLSIVQITV